MSLEHNKELVRAFYLDNGSISKDFFLPDFAVTAPNYLPWGGTTVSPDVYLGKVLPQVQRVIDFSTITIDSIVAEGDMVVVVISLAIRDSAERISISEHGVLRDDRAVSLWVAYFDPRAVLEKINRH